MKALVGMLLPLATVLGCSTGNKDDVKHVGLKPIDVRDTTVAITPGSGDGTGTPGGNDSVAVFARTTQPLLVKWCGGCHNHTFTPFFAQADAQKAHEAIMVGEKVNFKTVTDSRLVQRLAVEKHNCPTDIGCDVAAQQLTEAITQWAAAIADQTSDTPTLPTTATRKFGDAAAKNVPGSNPAGVMLFEGEDFTLKAPFQKTALTTASNGNIIELPANAPAQTNVTTATTSTTLGTATLTFNVTTAGNYRVQGLVNGATANNASFYLRMDAGALSPWIFTPNAAAYTWITAATTATSTTPTQFNLTAGSHTVEIRQRQPSAKLDKLVLSSVQAFDPALAQPAVRSVKVLTFDLAGITKVAGTQLTVEVSDYSANGYLFKNPTLVVPSGTVHVKDLRLLINGEFLAQHATWTGVDMDVAAPGAVLSTAALVAIKDQGLDLDEFSFAFGAADAK